MIGFRKKSQNGVSFSWLSDVKADGRVGAASSGAVQRSRIGRTKPTARAGKGRHDPAAGRRGYKASEQMDSRCLTLIKSTSGILSRSLDQALARFPEGPGAPAASQGPAGPAGAAGLATGSHSDAVGAPCPIRGRGTSVSSMCSTQADVGQANAVADIAPDIEF